jgi:hypothetical protein
VTNKLKPHQTAILVASAIVAVGYLTPSLHILFLPLYFLNVHIHELSHALAGLLSGGQVHSIHIDASSGGLTEIVGGSHWLVGPAGYVGASIVGAVIIWFSRSEKGAQNTLRALAVLLTLGLVFWVRSDAWGIFSGIIWVGVLLGAATFLKGLPLLFAAQFVGIAECFNSLNSLYDLVWVTTDPMAHSDALIMQRYTHVPAIVWAFGWCVVSLSLIVICLRRAWGSSSAKA